MTIFKQPGWHDTKIAEPYCQYRYGKPYSHVTCHKRRDSRFGTGRLCEEHYYQMLDQENEDASRD